MSEEIKIFKNKHSVAVAVVVATNTEFKVAINFLKPLQNEDGILKIYCKKVTAYCGIWGKYSVALVQTNNMGASREGGADDTVDEIIAELSPKAVIMAGIAFGKSEIKQNMFDILVSKTIENYEPNRMNENGTVTHRASTLEADTTLVNRFRGNGSHSFNLENEEFSISVHTGELLCGEKLVDNAQFKAELFQKFPDAIGGEMEGAGVGKAANSHKTAWVLVKSITDWGVGKKRNDGQIQRTETKKQKIGCYAAFTYLNKIFEEENVFQNLGVFSVQKQSSDLAEIYSADIIPLVCAKKEISTLLNSKKRVTLSPVRYDYFSYSNSGRVEGFLFFGANASIADSISHFMEHFKEASILNIFVIKRKVRGVAHDRMTKIKKEIQNNGLSQKVGDRVYYVDEYVNRSTLLNVDQTNYVRRKDYIDQDIYFYNDKDELLGKSVPFILNKLRSASASPVTMIFGSGGVGKTTFCGAVSKAINDNFSDLKKRIFMIKGDQLANNLKDDTKVRSVKELFAAYNQTFDEINLSADEFMLNLSCGNIVLIIDALDEIHSALGLSFDLERFLQSIVDLDKKWQRIQVIITSRDYFEEELREKLELDNTNSESFFSDSRNVGHVEIYRFLGFTHSDLDDYLKKRLPGINPKRAITLIEKMRLFSDGRVDPMLADFACETVDMDDSEFDDLTPRQSEYFVDSIPIDRVVTELLYRENVVQKTGLTIDDTFEIFVEMELVNKGVMEIEKLNEIVDLFNGDSKNFQKNPLLLSFNSGNKMTFSLRKYESLPTLVRARFFLDVMSNQKTGISIDYVLLILKDAYDGTNEIISYIVTGFKASSSITTSDFRNVFDEIKKVLHKDNPTFPK